jgi:hypothetical protein
MMWPKSGVHSQPALSLPLHDSITGSQQCCLARYMGWTKAQSTQASETWVRLGNPCSHFWPIISLSTVTGSLNLYVFVFRKSLHYLLQLLRKSAFPPWTLNRVNHLPQLNFKTVRFTSLIGYTRFSKPVLSFSFLFISVESLKNHSKLKKNHKMEI